MEFFQNGGTPKSSIFSRIFTFNLLINHTSWEPPFQATRISNDDRISYENRISYSGDGGDDDGDGDGDGDGDDDGDDDDDDHGLYGLWMVQRLCLTPKLIGGVGTMEEVQGEL